MESENNSNIDMQSHLYAIKRSGARQIIQIICRIMDNDKKFYKKNGILFNMLNSINDGDTRELDMFLSECCDRGLWIDKTGKLIFKNIGEKENE